MACLQLSLGRRFTRLTTPFSSPPTAKRWTTWTMRGRSVLTLNTFSVRLRSRDGAHHGVSHLSSIAVQGRESRLRIRSYWSVEDDRGRVVSLASEFRP